MNVLKQGLKSIDPRAIDDDMGTVFITSGTSAVGYRVANSLLDAGYEHIRVGVWKGQRQVGVDNSIGQQVQDQLEAKGATVISFDCTNADDYTMALAGVNTVFCTLPQMKESSDTFHKFVEACIHNGVEHFVKVSFYKLENDHSSYRKNVDYVKFHRKCDEDLVEDCEKLTTRMTYTLLRASHLMSVPLIYQGPVLRKDSKYVTASYAMGVNYVSPNDIAKAAVFSLVNRKQNRDKIYDLTGPHGIRDKDVAKLLSKFYGKEIMHVPIGYHEIVDEFKSRGFDKWLVLDLANMELVKASGVDEKSDAYFEDLETLIGKKPEDFKSYLANKEAMTLQENPDRAAI